MSLFRLIDLGFRRSELSPVVPAAVAVDSSGATPSASQGRTQGGRSRQVDVPDIRRTLLVWLCLVAGIVGQWFLDAYSKGDDFHLEWKGIVAALTIGGVIMRLAWERVVSLTANRALQYFAAFENGFFWNSLMKSLALVLQSRGPHG